MQRKTYNVDHPSLAFVPGGKFDSFAAFQDAVKTPLMAAAYAALAGSRPGIDARTAPTGADFIASGENLPAAVKFEFGGVGGWVRAAKVTSQRWLDR